MAGSKLRIEDRAGVTLVTFEDTALVHGQTIERAAAELYELIDRKHALKLILDFSDVKLLASQMLSVLLTLNNKSQAAGGALVLCGLGEELKSIFAITNLDKIFTFCTDTSSALAHFELYGT